MKRIKIEFNTREASFVTPAIPTQKVAVWQPNCFKWFLKYLASVNTEITVYKQGLKLVIHDKDIGFYRCTPPGDMVEIPLYERPVIFEDEFPPIIDTKLQSEGMMREWGLIK